MVGVLVPNTPTPPPQETSVLQVYRCICIRGLFVFLFSTRLPVADGGKKARFRESVSGREGRGAPTPMARGAQGGSGKVLVPRTRRTIARNTCMNIDGGLNFGLADSHF